MLQPVCAADNNGNLIGALAGFVRAKAAPPTCSPTHGAGTTPTPFRRSQTRSTGR
jgi:hypothetical protein